jgi:hypothetical protein
MAGTIATAVLGTTLQALSAAHDVDDSTGRRGGNALSKILPETRGQKLDLTADDLKDMIADLQKLNLLVKKSRTKEDQDLYREISHKVRDFYGDLEGLMAGKSADSWRNALRFSDERGAKIQDLRKAVSREKDRLFSKSQKIETMLLANASCLEIQTETSSATAASSTSGQYNSIAAASTGPAVQRKSLKVTLPCDVFEMVNIQSSGGSDPLGVTTFPVPSFLPSSTSSGGIPVRA